MSASQRRKGHDFERLVASLIREAGFDARTTRQAAPMEDARGRDIICPGLPFAIQCKAGRTVRPALALREATEAAAAGELPVAILHDARAGERLVVMRLTDWLLMLRTIPLHTDALQGPVAGQAAVKPSRLPGPNISRPGPS